MKLETKSVINGRAVVHVFENRGISIYENEDDETMFICKGNDVVFEMSVDPSLGEGGGGSIDINKV